MNVVELCKVRTIPGTNFQTPLLVPSYSSRGFDPSPIYEDTNQYCQDSKLLSAYDIRHKLIDPKHIYSADLLFIDSGHYERIPTHNPGEPYEDMRRGEESWSIPLYDEALKSLDTDQCKIVRVTYDRPDLVRNQVAGARKSAKNVTTQLSGLRQLQL
ncbi:MAG: hypothetical protein L3K17_04835 [Thermoplasmata archaeon]|nr:hypothetical protein [Thermoplasmata archaeon]